MVSHGNVDPALEPCEKQLTVGRMIEFSMLMGDEVPPREFIEKNAVYANIDA
jgi:hypothetical protein